MIIEIPDKIGNTATHEVVDIAAEMLQEAARVL